MWYPPGIPQTRRKLWIWLQLIVAYTFIECALWSSPMDVRNRWALVAAITVLVFILLDRPSIQTMGLSLPSTTKDVIRLVLSLAVAVLLIVEVLWHEGRGEMGTMMHYLYSSAGYLAWALLQQFLLQSFFFTRCEELFATSTAVWAAATLFAAAHLPSLILTTITLAGGLFFCEMFRRVRSIYPIALLHAALGLTLAMTLPDNLTHHMRTGIGYLNYR